MYENPENRYRVDRHQEVRHTFTMCYDSKKKPRSDLSFTKAIEQEVSKAVLEQCITRKVLTNWRKLREQLHK